MPKATEQVLTLRDLRERKGLSQRKLAAAAGVHYTTVYYHENGLKEPTFDVLKKEVEALGGKLMVRFRGHCYPFEVTQKGEGE